MFHPLAACLDVDWACYKEMECHSLGGKAFFFAALYCSCLGFKFKFDMIYSQIIDSTQQSLQTRDK